MGNNDRKDFDALMAWALAPLLRAMREEARTGYAWNAAPHRREAPTGGAARPAGATSTVISKSKVHRQS